MDSLIGLPDYDQSGLGDTTAVGSYPAGASWCAALDMAGNVWEWTQSLYWPYPYSATDGRENPDASGSRLVRGGAFEDGGGSARSTLRHEYDPDERYYSKGFRVVVPAERD